MDINTSNLLLAAGGSGSGGGASSSLFVDDLFRTFTYNGNGSTQTITTGIDNTEKALVWIKCRTPSNENHMLFDTENGVNKFLATNTTNPLFSTNNGVTAFNSDGFTTGNNGATNGGSKKYVAWNFKAAPGFFDIVKYTGTGSVQNISHNLGSVPGMIMVRCLVGTHDWEVYHRSTGAGKSLHINQTAAANNDGSVWNSTTPTSTEFTVGTNGNVNQNGHTYVAYIFAHDDQSFGENQNESIIKCGDYAGTGYQYNEINVGFEPEFLIFKNITSNDNWYVMDTMRGLTANGSPDAYMFPNSTSTEGQASFMYATSTGFGFTATGSGANSSGDQFIYLAIRRQNKPPVVASDVFEIQTKGAYSANEVVPCNFVPDMFIAKDSTTTYPWYIEPRLTDRWMNTNNTDPEPTSSSLDYFKWDSPGGKIETGSYTGDPIFYQFKRAPGFLDVVTWRGNGSTRQIPHNLGVTPEFLVIKSRTTSEFFIAYTTLIDGSMDYGELHNSSSQFQDSQNSAPTSTHINLTSGSVVNGSGIDYVAYAFATLPGISKVGVYTGNHSDPNDNNIVCGFTSGARFVLIRRTDSYGSWYVYDTSRGIVNGNDPYFALNDNAAQSTNSDYIDPYSAGFTINQNAPAMLNSWQGKFFFLAIA